MMRFQDDEANEKYYDEKYEELKSEGIEGHHLVGSIICDVWRWEATDINSLPPGFEHYYRTGCPQDNEEIYSRLNLIE